MGKYWFWTLFIAFVATLIAAPNPNMARTRLADGFDYPVGKPDGEGYYVARGWLRHHPGEDWNGLGGGNTDLGDPVYSIGNGLVVFARDARRGWGNVVIVRHSFIEGGQLQTADSFYAHLERVTVREGQQVVRGEQIGTIGTNRGMYSAHLHFEIRRNLAIGINRSAYRIDLNNYHVPRRFIDARRNLPGRGRSALVAVNTFNHGNRQFDPPTDERRYVSSGQRSRTRVTRNSSNQRSQPAPQRAFRVNRYDDMQTR